jgi:hypothetical protein
MSMCRPCNDRLRNVLSPCSSCRQSSTCACHVCIRQPPTLKGTASRVVLHLLYNLPELTLSHDTTYPHYVFVVNNRPLPIAKLVPLDYNTLDVIFAVFESSPNQRFHFEYIPGNMPDLPWYGRSQQRFDSAIDCLAALVNNRHVWLCDHCNKPLFTHCDAHGHSWQCQQQFHFNLNIFVVVVGGMCVYA